MEKLKVNGNICIGCGACAGTYPNIFQFNDEGIAEVIEENQNQESEDAEEMVEICPVGAISSEKID